MPALAICGGISLTVTGAAALPVHSQTGIASWYGAREAGRRTASGILFDPSRLSAAHRTFPLGSCLRVSRLRTQKTIIVPIIDRGPYIHGRLLDLSEAAAARLGMIAQGLAKVRIALVDCPSPLFPKTAS
jgi:peptidoglycan lytic transglycosylase